LAVEKISPHHRILSLPPRFSMRSLLYGMIGLALLTGAAERGTGAAEAQPWVPLFDGTSLAGWHVSAKTGHSGPSKHTSGGRWVVEDGAIVGSQDQPGNGGIILTDREFGDFEVVVEMKNDFGPDSGLFLRSTEEGAAYQAMIDYHADGNLMGIYGEGLGGRPHIRNYSFKDTVTVVEPQSLGDPRVPFPILPEGLALVLAAWPVERTAGQNRRRANAHNHNLDQRREDFPVDRNRGPASPPGPHRPADPRRR